MLLTISFVASLSVALVSARPPSAPTAHVRRAIPAAAAPVATSFSAGVVTLEYIEGTSTFKDVQTYIDYGTAIPSNVLAQIGTDTAGLPVETDPCGPKVQDSYSPPTCNPSGTLLTTTNDIDAIEAFGYDANYVYQVDTPAAYGVQCLNSTTSKAAINTKNCDVTAVDVCNKIRSNYSPRGKWVWSTVGGPGCAMAYWLPAYNGSAPAPLKDRCEQGIYQTMVDLCITTPDGYYGLSNVAAVNLVQLPGTNGTGQQVNAGYPSK